MKKILLFSAFLGCFALGHAQTKNVVVETAGTLSTLIPAEEVSTLTTLTVSGSINKTDLDTLTTIVERYQKQDTWKTDPTVSPEGFVLIQKIMMEGKELSQEIPYDSIVVTEFAEKVMTGK